MGKASKWGRVKMHPFNTDDEYREWWERNTLNGAMTRLQREWDALWQAMLGNDLGALLDAYPWLYYVAAMLLTIIVAVALAYGIWGS